MRLLEVRLSHNLTQKQVANDLGISQNALCQYEKGIRKVSGDFLIKLADYYGCSLDDLAGREVFNGIQGLSRST